MKFKGSESPLSSAEKIKDLESKLKTLQEQLGYLEDKKDISGIDIITNDGRAKAKRDRKEVKREIMNVRNELNKELILSSNSPKKNAEIKKINQEIPSIGKLTKETNDENPETGAEYFGSSMEDIDLVTRTIQSEADKTVENLNSEGLQDLQRIEQAEPTEEELIEVRKKQGKINQQGESHAQELKKELLVLTFPEMIAIDNLDDKQLESKLNEVDNFLKTNKIDLAYEENQEIQSDTEKKYSKEMVAIGAYRRELLQKKLNADKTSRDKKMPPNEKLEIPKQIDLKLQESDAPETFKPLLEEGYHDEIVDDIMKMAGLMPKDFVNFDYRVRPDKDKSRADIIFSKRDTTDAEFTITVDLSSKKIEKITDEERMRMFDELTTGFARRGELIKQKNAAKNPEDMERLDDDLSEINSKLNTLYEKLNRSGIEGFNDNERKKIKQIGDTARSSIISSSFKYFSGMDSGDYVTSTIRKYGGGKKPEEADLNKAINNKTMENINIPTSPETQSVKKPSFDNIVFSSVSESKNLLDMVHEFYVLLEENNLKNEQDAVTEFGRFLEKYDPAHLEAAKSKIETCEESEAKEKLKELLAKCEVLVKAEQEEQEKYTLSDSFGIEIKSADGVEKLPDEELIKEWDEANNKINEIETEKLAKAKLGDDKNMLLEDLKKTKGYQKLFEYLKLLTEVKSKRQEGSEKAKWAMFIKEVNQTYLDFLEDATKPKEPSANADINKINTIIEEINEEFDTKESMDEELKQNLSNFGLEHSDDNISKARKIIEGFKINTINSLESIKKIIESESVAPEPMTEPIPWHERLNKQKSIDEIKNKIKEEKDYLNYLEKRTGLGEDVQDLINKHRMFLDKLNASLGDQTTVDKSRMSPEPAESETIIDVGTDLLKDENILNEIKVEKLEEEMNRILKYFNETELSDDQKSSIDKYTDKLQTRMNELKKITDSPEYKKIKQDANNINKTIIQIERPSKNEELSNIRNAKTSKDLEDAIKSIAGEGNTNAKELKSLLEGAYSSAIDPEGNLKDTANSKDFANLIKDLATDAELRSYIESFFVAIENIKTEEKGKFKIGDKVFVKDEDNGSVRDGWIVDSVDGNDITVKNEDTGKKQTIEAGVLRSYNNVEFIEKINKRKKRIEELEERIKLLEYTAEQSQEYISKNEEYLNLKKELKELRKETGLKTDMETIFKSDDYKKVLKDIEKINSSKLKFKSNPAFEITRIQTAKDLKELDNVKIYDRKLLDCLNDIVTLFTDSDGKIKKGVDFEEARKAMATEIMNDDAKSYVSVLLKTLERFRDNEIAQESPEKDAKDTEQKKPKDMRDAIENLKKMVEVLEKRQILFENLEADEDIKEVVEKVSSEQKLSALEEKLYRSRSMARDEVTLANIGVSMSRGYEYYKKSMLNLSHEEQMKLMDAEIMRLKIQNGLYKDLAISIHTTNQKMDQLAPKQRSAAGKIVDAMLGAAKNIPILNRLVYKSEALKGKENEVVSNVKENDIIDIKEKNATSEGWKVIGVEGDKLKVEKIEKGEESVKLNDVKKMNGISENDNLTIGQILKIVRSDGRIDEGWKIVKIEGKKVSMTKDDMRVEKLISNKDVIGLNKQAESKKSAENLSQILNGFKADKFDLTKIKNNADLKNAIELLESEFRKVAQNDNFAKLEQGIRSDLESVMTIETKWYSRFIDEKISKKVSNKTNDDRMMSDTYAKNIALINKLPEQFKDFKEGMIALITHAKKSFDDAKYSDEKKDKNIEKAEINEVTINKILNDNVIQRINKSKTWNGLIKNLETIKNKTGSKSDDKTMTNISELINILLENFDLEERRQRITTFPESNRKTFNSNNPEFADNAQVKKFIGSVFYTMSVLAAKEMEEKKDSNKKPPKRDTGAGSGEKGENRSELYSKISEKLDNIKNPEDFKNNFIEIWQSLADIKTKEFGRFPVALNVFTDGSDKEARRKASRHYENTDKDYFDVLNKLCDKMDRLEEKEDENDKPPKQDTGTGSGERGERKNESQEKQYYYLDLKNHPHKEFSDEEFGAELNAIKNNEVRETLKPLMHFYNETRPVTATREDRENFLSSDSGKNIMKKYATDFKTLQETIDRETKNGNVKEEISTFDELKKGDIISISSGIQMYRGKKEDKDQDKSMYLLYQLGPGLEFTPSGAIFGKDTKSMKVKKLEFININPIQSDAGSRNIEKGGEVDNSAEKDQIYDLGNSPKEFENIDSIFRGTTNLKPAVDALIKLLKIDEATVEDFSLRGYGSSSTKEGYAHHAELHLSIKGNKKRIIKLSSASEKEKLININTWEEEKNR